MGQSSKKFYLAGAGVFFLIFLLLALAFIVPKIVDSAWLKERIQTTAAKQISGDLAFHKAELSILPVPVVSLQQVSLAIPETARIHLDTLRVYPKLLPLLTGNIAISKTVVEKPDFSIQLPEKAERTKNKEKLISFSGAVDNTFAKLAPILAAIPGLNAGVHNGTLRLFAGSEELFLFQDINGSFTVSTNSLSAAVSCSSNIWDFMEVQAFDVDSDSAQANVYGDGEILSVQYKESPVKEIPQEDVRALDAKKIQLTRQRTALQHQKELLARSVCEFLRQFLL